MAATVDVCCKLPNGLHLTVFRMEEHVEPVMGGGSRTVHRAVADGRTSIRGVGRRGHDDPRIVGGYAVTHGVDAAIWARWLEQNRDSDVVRNRLIFADEKPGMATGKAREQAEILSGLEPLNPDKPSPEFARKIERAKVA